jgi:hypothetical protein
MEESKVGFYKNVLHELYLTWPGASYSTLSKLLISPKHCQLAQKGKLNESSQALSFGSAVHCAVFEPKRFEKEYAALPEGLDKRFKEGKEQYKALCLKYGGGNHLLTAYEHEKVTSLALSVRKHSAAGKLLSNLTDIEVSCIWKDSESGVMCKGRIDAISEVFQCVIDLKTCADPRHYPFAKAIYHNQYYLQAAHYLKAMEGLGKPVKNYLIIAVEKEFPFGVQVYRLAEPSIEACKIQRAKLLQMWAACEAANEWPCFSSEIEDIDIPPYGLELIGVPGHKGNPVELI